MSTTKIFDMTLLLKELKYPITDHIVLYVFEYAEFEYVLRISVTSKHQAIISAKI